MGMPPLFTDTHGGLYDDRGQDLVNVMIALIVLSTAFVLLRLLSRRLAHAGYWWDDVLIVVALLLSLANPAINIYGVKHTGFGKHVVRFGDEGSIYTTNSLKMLYTFQLFFALSTGVIKLCILTFYRRIFPIQQLRKALYMISGVVVSFTITVVLLTVFQCNPITRFWNPASPGSCTNIYNVLIVTGSINTALDFIIVLMPVPLLWQLRTSRPQKCVLTGIFLIAGFVCIVSILRLTAYSRSTASDITWHSVDVTLWSAVEPCAGVISACIPSLRPLVTLALRAAHVKLPNLHRSTNRPYRGSQASMLPWLAEAGERTRSDSKVQWPQNTLNTVSSAMEHMHSREAQAAKKLENGNRIEELEVPYGSISVKTEIRWSVQDRYDYDYRVY